MSNNGFVRCMVANVGKGLANSTAFKTNFFSFIDDVTNKKKVQIAVFPELCVTGYTCQDLFFNQTLYDDAITTLKFIVSASKNYNTLLIIGCPIKIDDAMYNCAIAIFKGEILGIVPKHFVPANEKRWFTEYVDNEIKYIQLFDKTVPFGNLIFSSSLGYKLGIEIGDDLWSVIPPSSNLALAGANIIANLSASNELVGKAEYRKELIKIQSAKTISAYLYVSSGFNESTSDLVFGGAGYIFENGKMLKELSRFNQQNSYTIADIDIEDISNERLYNKTFNCSRKFQTAKYTEIPFSQYDNIFDPSFRDIQQNPFVPTTLDERNKACEEIISIQSTGLARRLKSINNEKVTLGISGGLDSTLALLVCYDAFKRLNLDLKGIIGITMPGFGTTNRTYNNAVKLCAELGITLKEIPIRDACVQHFKDIEHDISVHDITYENAQARERTQILMDMANKHQAMLVGTGDLSELVLGWCTYNGDHMSMYNVNGSVPKTLIKHLIKWYAEEVLKENEALKNILLDIIDTPISPELLPTDGKEVVQKTENSVGPYELIDFFIYYFLRKHFDKYKILILARIAFNDKYSSDELIQYYNAFNKRFYNNQFKRNCLPDGPKVGSVGVSPRGDLLIPSDIY